ncbi:kininogen-1 isoform X1 [Oreochromis aureus]|uniref:Cystatin kininogen-type domain-containing protein n=1 Tax=Oreochromis aureus TaxID=47969 RepID=A0A668TN38_OREAU|nr:kininogen-1 isoform X1 [Oreochromis aureus]XP_031589658.1 kininogen-1 isoform X1 [Oreochromis aureus]
MKMRSGVGLCVLGLLGLLCSVFGQEAAEVQSGVLIFCDDPSVQKAVHSAVDKFNERLSTGHKLALFQILKASKSENGSDSVYSLKFTTWESECTADSSIPWTECDYLQSGSKGPISCNATVLMSETEAETKQVDCQIEGHIVPEKATCLGCPEPINEDSEDLKVPLSVSISKYNSMSDSTHLFSLHNIGRATRQVVAGFRFKLIFDMKKTVCSKAEHTDLKEMCIPDDKNEEFANCNSTVDVAPWRLEPPQAHIECAPGKLPTTQFTRRRPPGWSPLRHFLYEVKPPATATSSPSQPPTTAKTKESSEEDTTSATPSVLRDANAKDHLFHCPSKPWKALKPPHSAASTKASVEAASPQPRPFKDTDLQS